MNATSKAALAIAGAGALLCWALAAGVALWAASERSWDRLAATVTASELSSHKAPCDGDTIRLCEFFEPRVRYTYRVRAADYIGDRISSRDQTSLDRELALTTLARFPIHASVPVWVDPHDPRRALLEPGSSSRAVPIFVIVGLAWAAVWGFIARAAAHR